MATAETERTIEAPRDLVVVGASAGGVETLRQVIAGLPGQLPATICVVPSGAQDDGWAGLALIKARGGAAVVQHPEGARYPGMPASAIANVAVDVVAGAAETGSTIVEIVHGRLAIAEDPPPDPPAAGNAGTTVTICPERGGVLSEHEEAGAIQWECRVGHRYSPASLLDAQSSDVEAALWTAVRALEDRYLLLRRMAAQMESRRQPRTARSFRRRSEEALAQSELVREALSNSAQTSLRSVSLEDDEDEAPGQEQEA